MVDVDLRFIRFPLLSGEPLNIEPFGGAEAALALSRKYDRGAAIHTLSQADLE